MYLRPELEVESTSPRNREGWPLQGKVLEPEEGYKRMAPVSEIMTQLLGEENKLIEALWYSNSLPPGQSH